MVTSVSVAGLQAKFLYDPLFLLSSLLVAEAFLWLTRASCPRGPSLPLFTIPLSDWSRQLLFIKKFGWRNPKIRRSPEGQTSSSLLQCITVALPPLVTKSVIVLASQGGTPPPPFFPGPGYKVRNVPKWQPYLMCNGTSAIAADSGVLSKSTEPSIWGMGSPGGAERGGHLWCLCLDFETCMFFLRGLMRQRWSLLWHTGRRCPMLAGHRLWSGASPVPSTGCPNTLLAKRSWAGKALRISWFPGHVPSALHSWG